MKKKAPKLGNLGGPCVIIKQLSDVIFCIRKLSKHKNKVVHSIGWLNFSKDQSQEMKQGITESGIKVQSLEKKE